MIYTKECQGNAWYVNKNGMPVLSLPLIHHEAIDNIVLLLNEAYEEGHTDAYDAGYAAGHVDE